MKLITLLREAKQAGILYHYTSAEGLKGILSSNSIKASEGEYMGQTLYYVSFTRNRNLHKKPDTFGVPVDYRITIDGNKLSNKYKIRPIAEIPGWIRDAEDEWVEYQQEYGDEDLDDYENVAHSYYNNPAIFSEQEERVVFKNPNQKIDNIKDYIIAIDKLD